MSSLNPTIPADVMKRILISTIGGAVIGLLIANIAYSKTVIDEAESQAIQRLRMEGIPEAELRKELGKRYSFRVVYWNAPHIPWVMGGLGIGAGTGAIIAAIWSFAKSKSNGATVKEEKITDSNEQSTTG